MQSQFPITVTSNGNIKKFGVSLKFDGNALSYPSNLVDVTLGNGVTGGLHAAFNGDTIGIYLDNANIPAGTFPVFFVRFETKPGLTGLTQVQLWGSPQPFEAYSSSSALKLDSNGGGLIDLATGAAQPASVVATGGDLVLVSSDPIPTPTPPSTVPTPVSTIVPPSVTPFPTTSDVPHPNPSVNVAPVALPVASPLSGILSKFSVSSITSNPLALLIALGIGYSIIKKK